ncbi:hypothetical protein GGU11DRAFT_101477 [Lentinula aff. detonsa]|nr:hypothetical protein GGU11DRAFT_101477 [Lentinula aff. detonsa]
MYCAYLYIALTSSLCSLYIFSLSCLLYIEPSTGRCCRTYQCYLDATFSTFCFFCVLARNSVLSLLLAFEIYLTRFQCRYILDEMRGQTLDEKTSLMSLAKHVKTPTLASSTARAVDD